MLNTLIALPYEAARLPLALVEDRLSDRLPEAVGSRMSLMLGSADKVVGTVLRNPRITRRGVERVERSERLLTAVRLEHRADARREGARDVAVAGRREAARNREAARDRAATGLEEAEAVEERGKRAAQDRADQAAAARKGAADQHAVARKSAADRRKAEVASVAQAQRTTAQRRARTELDDAREDRESASEARADAERLSELADTKRRQRKRS